MVNTTFDIIKTAQSDSLYTGMYRFLGDLSVLYVHDFYV